MFFINNSIIINDAIDKFRMMNFNNISLFFIFVKDIFTKIIISVFIHKDNQLLDDIIINSIVNDNNFIISFN